MPPYLADFTHFLVTIITFHILFVLLPPYFRLLHQLFSINQKFVLNVRTLYLTWDDNALPIRPKRKNYSWIHTPSVVVVTDTQAYYYIDLLWKETYVPVFQYSCFKLHAAAEVQVISSCIGYSSCIPGIVVPLLALDYILMAL